MSDTTDIAVHPVQRKRDYDQAYAPQVVTMRAYEVYCHIHAPQPAMVTGGCRGGFSAGELIAFLYAYSFPKTEWRERTQEAFRGMKIA